MKKILQFLDDKFEEIIGILLLSIVICLIFIGVMMRLVLKSGVPWQEEISRILYVLLVYLGASYGLKSQDHIRIVMVFNLFPDKVKRVLRVFTDIIWIGFNISAIVISYQVIENMLKFVGRTAVLKIPMHYVFATIPFGFFLMTLRLIQNYIQKPIKEK